jgi:branched-chain amino acid transport system substrate-binding protein
VSTPRCRARRPCRRPRSSPARSSTGGSVGKVAGRDVRVIVRDDQYNPSRATSVCNQMIQQDQVFLLVGGGGADQIAACARTAAQQGVPYLSAGVDEGALRQLPNYFALSLSYPQQAPLIAQYIDKQAEALRRPRGDRP